MSYIKNGKNKLNSLLTYGDKKLSKLILDTIANISGNLEQEHAEHLSGNYFETVFNNKLSKIINMEEEHYEIVGILIKLTKKNKAIEGYEEGINKNAKN